YRNLKKFINVFFGRNPIKQTRIKTDHPSTTPTSACSSMFQAVVKGLLGSFKGLWCSLCNGISWMQRIEVRKMSMSFFWLLVRLLPLQYSSIFSNDNTW